MQMLNTAALCWRVKLRNAICLAFALALTGCSASKPAGVLRLPGAGGGSDGAGADWIGGFCSVLRSIWRPGCRCCKVGRPGERPCRALSGRGP